MALYRVAPYYHYIYDGALLENPQGWRDFRAALTSSAMNEHESARMQIKEKFKEKRRRGEYWRKGNYSKLCCVNTFYSTHP